MQIFQWKAAGAILSQYTGWFTTWSVLIREMICVEPVPDPSLYLAVILPVTETDQKREIDTPPLGHPILYRDRWAHLWERV